MSTVKEEANTGRELYEVVFTGNNNDGERKILGPYVIEGKNRFVAAVTAAIQNFDAVKGLKLTSINVKIKDF